MYLLILLVIICNIQQGYSACIPVKKPIFKQETSIPTIVVSKSNAEIVQMPEDQLLKIRVHGRQRTCRIDECTLICEGDQALINICKFLPKDSNLSPSNCKVHDGCTLSCNNTEIVNLCQTSRKLGNIDPNIRSTSSDRLWTKGRICYQIDNNVNKETVMKAMEHWTTYSGITFSECHENSSTCCDPCGEYIKIIKGIGCWSFIGRIGGACESGGQRLSVGDACSVGNVIHEFGHALGLRHEHNRVDRDKYVKIDFDNIQKNYEHNFELNGDNFFDNGQYDYGSIMHYNSEAFAINPNLPTITPIDPSNGNNRHDISIGQRKSLSMNDVETIHRLYRNELPETTRFLPIPGVNKTPENSNTSETVATIAVISAFVVMGVVVIQWIHQFYTVRQSKKEQQRYYDEAILSVPTPTDEISVI